MQDLTPLMLLHSTLALIDTGGSVQTNYTYEPFGKTIATGTVLPNAARYTGREDDGTGLYYYRARYYHPELQRFISQDPLSYAGGDMNLYGYTANNPINFRDPSGLTIYICVRRAKFPVGLVGNHEYLWNCIDGSCCGRGSNESCSEKGPAGDNCIPIPGSEGREDELMDCCRKSNTGINVPPINDCFQDIDQCLDQTGIPNPGDPAGRFPEHPCPPEEPCKPMY